MKKNIIGTGIIAAFGASLCCITPVLALIAGTGGIASTFSWIEPFRPYLIGLTFLALGYAWYLKLKPAKEIDCNCETDKKQSIFQSKLFLTIITVFAILMIFFPYYAHIFYPENKPQIVVGDKVIIQTIEVDIKGMTCIGCEEHVNHEVSKLDGIITTKASYKNGSAIIEFEQGKVNLSQIEEAINSTGYSVVSKNIK